MGETAEPGLVVDVKKHGHRGNDVEGPWLEVRRLEITDDVVDVVSVGTRLRNARFVAVETDDRRNYPPEPPCGLALATPDI